VLLVSATLVSVSAEDRPPPTLTFEGAVGGGAIRLTTTADRTGIVRAEVIDVHFPPCLVAPPPGGAVGVLAYNSPPAPVIDGAFAFSVSIRLPLQSFFFEGAFVSENAIEGITQFSYFLSPSLHCVSDERHWTLEGPVESPPGPDDLVFAGSVKDGSGGIIVTTDPSRASVTSLTLDSVSMPPCTDESGPLQVVAPLDPPIPVEATDNSFRVGTLLAPGFRGLTLDGSFVDEETIAGMLSFGSLDGQGCNAEALWNAGLKGTATPVVVGGISVDLDADRGRPALETPDSSGGNVGVLAGVAAAMIAGAIALGGAAWYARRRW
jgi:hypothetical protein